MRLLQSLFLFLRIKVSKTSKIPIRQQGLQSLILLC